ncbi:hypothetical protein HanPSC8_Chr16g0742581 [Helianthus annuus]|nr:hypothetical protein HanPSC8_Chr16g0742581 [Helianthus annuus]
MLVMVQYRLDYENVICIKHELLCFMFNPTLNQMYCIELKFFLISCNHVVVFKNISLYK